MWERVYAVFGDGSFAALTADGQVTWLNRDFPFYSEHGLGPSPILWNDLLIIARDGSSGGPDKRLGWRIPWNKSFVMALDKSSGTLGWKSGQGLSRIAHVSPNIRVAPDGRAQVISGAGDVVQGLDAVSGERIWSSKNTGEGLVASIVLGGEFSLARLVRGRYPPWLHGVEVRQLHRDGNPDCLRLGLFA